MKKLLVFILIAVSMTVAVKTAFASEGSTLLSSERIGTRCFVASVLIAEGRYRVVASCRDLSVPPASETLFYHAWAKRQGVQGPTGTSQGPLFGRGPYLSLGDITGGKLTAEIRDPFDEVVVTSESEVNPKDPSLDRIIVSGLMKPFEFGSAATTMLGSTPTESIAAVTVRPTPRLTPSPSASSRNVVGTAVRVFMIILGIVVVVAIVISILQRRSASR